MTKKAIVPYTMIALPARRRHRCCRKKYILSFMGLGLAFLVGLLMFVLKSVRAFLMTVSVSAGGVATLLLAAAVFRIPLSMVTVILPVIVIFYGTSGSLHVLFHRGDFRKVVGPCSMAVLTTVLGFLTFWPSSIPLLKDFAVLGTAGIAGGFAWALLLFFPRRYSFEPRADIERFFRNFPVASRASVLAVFLALTAAMAPGILKLKAYIGRDGFHPVRKDGKPVQSAMAPYGPGSGIQVVRFPLPVFLGIDQVQESRIARIAAEFGVGSVCERIGMELAAHRMLSELVDKCQPLVRLKVSPLGVQPQDKKIERIM